MSDTDKIGNAIRRSLQHIPFDARAIVSSLLQPQTLAVIAGTLVVWAGSHAFGVGMIVDIILLGIGVVALGFAVFEGPLNFTTSLLAFLVRALMQTSRKPVDTSHAL